MIRHYYIADAYPASPQAIGAGGGTAQVVAFVRDLIDRGRVRAGDRLPTEREIAVQIASLADEVASLFERMGDPLRLLNHDITFHRTSPRRPAIRSSERWSKRPASGHEAKAELITPLKKSA